MRSEGPQRLLGAARSPAAATPGLGEPPAPGQRGRTGGDTASGVPRLELPVTRAKCAGMLPERSSLGGSGRGMQLGTPKRAGGTNRDGGDLRGKVGDTAGRGEEWGDPQGSGPPRPPASAAAPWSPFPPGVTPAVSSPVPICPPRSSCVLAFVSQPCCRPAPISFCPINPRHESRRQKGCNLIRA